MSESSTCNDKGTLVSNLQHVKNNMWQSIQLKH